MGRNERLSADSEPFFVNPLAGSRFERTAKLPRKGLTDAHLAMWLLSTRLSEGLASKSTASNPVSLFNP
jgi:hypothetical protein